MANRSCRFTEILMKIHKKFLFHKFKKFLIYKFKKFYINISTDGLKNYQTLSIFKFNNVFKQIY